MNLLPDTGNEYVDVLACMGINLIHEMAHTFGLNDRYEGYNHNDNGYQCVMEYYQYDEDIGGGQSLVSGDLEIFLILL